MSVIYTYKYCFKRMGRNFMDLPENKKKKKQLVQTVQSNQYYIPTLINNTQRKTLHADDHKQKKNE